MSLSLLTQASNDRGPEAITKRLFSEHARLLGWDVKAEALTGRGRADFFLKDAAGNTVAIVEAKASAKDTGKGVKQLGRYCKDHVNKLKLPVMGYVVTGITPGNLKLHAYLYQHNAKTEKVEGEEACIKNSYGLTRHLQFLLNPEQSAHFMKWAATTPERPTVRQCASRLCPP